MIQATIRVSGLRPHSSNPVPLGASSSDKAAPLSPILLTLVIMLLPPVLQRFCCVQLPEKGSGRADCPNRAAQPRAFQHRGVGEGSEARPCRGEGHEGERGRAAGNCLGTRRGWRH